jgi:DNA-binding NtrC family response regulator
MEVRKMGFDMPFIAMTGHSDQLNDYNFREKGFASLLQKPVAMNELERVILNVLESTNFGSASS